MSDIDDAIRETLAAMLPDRAVSGTSSTTAPETSFSMADLQAALARIEAIDAEFELSLRLRLGIKPGEILIVPRGSIPMIKLPKWIKETDLLPDGMTAYVCRDHFGKGS